VNNTETKKGYEINGILKRKSERVQHVVVEKIYIKCNISRVAVRPSYI